MLMTNPAIDSQEDENSQEPVSPVAPQTAPQAPQDQGGMNTPPQVPDSPQTFTPKLGSQPTDLEFGSAPVAPKTKTHEDFEQESQSLMSSIPSPPPQTAMDYSNDDIQHARDAASRQITPQTYESMFANKSTLGKVGTLFGLMLSGAGSGLAHQSNMVMDMMNNVIRNDIEAQKTNVANSQNFLNMAYQYQLNQSQIRRNEWSNAFTKSQISQIPYQNALTQAQIYQQQLLSQGQSVENANHKADLYLKRLMIPLQAEQAKLGLQQTKSQIGLQQAQTQFAQTQTKGAEAENIGKLAEANVKAAKSGQILSALTGQPNPSVMPAQNPGPAPMMQEVYHHPDDIKEAHAVAPLRAENFMRTAALQHLEDQSANNPQAKAMIQNSLVPAVAAANEANNQKAQQISEAIDAQSHAIENQDVINDRGRFERMMQLGQIGGPGLPASIAIDPADQAEIAKEIQAAKLNRQQANQWRQGFQQLQDMENAGQVRYGNIWGSALSGAGALAGTAAGSSLGPLGKIGGGILGGALGSLGGKSVDEIIKNQERARNSIINGLQSQIKDGDVSNFYPAYTDKEGNKGKVRQNVWQQGNSFWKNREEQVTPLLTNKYHLKNDFFNMPYDPRSYISPQDFAMKTIPPPLTPHEESEDFKKSLAESGRSTRNPRDRDQL